MRGVELRARSSWKEDLKSSHVQAGLSDEAVKFFPFSPYPYFGYSLFDLDFCTLQPMWKMASSSWVVL